MTGFGTEVRQLVRERANADYDSDYIVCEIMVCCQGRATAQYDLHHRRNRAAGGSKRPDTNLAGNCLAACRDCHNYLGAHPEIAYRNGWLVRQTETPALVPVLYRHRWCLLSDDGSVSEASCVCGEISDSGWYPGKCVCVEEVQ